MSRAIILVVEDEPVQRMDLVDLVTEAGFEPVEAASADEAVRILETRSDIRLVFTDIEMPGSMDGMRLAAAVRNRWPPIEIILTSAGKAPELQTLPARSIFLPKPFRPRDAIAAMRKMAA